MMNRRSFCISSTSIAAAIALASRAETAEGATIRKDVKAAKSISIPMDEGKARSLFEAYRKHAAERAALGIPPLPLNPEQVTALVFFLAWLKGLGVMLEFMELRHAPASWRLALLGGFSAIVGGVLLAAGLANNS